MSVKLQNRAQVWSYVFGSKSSHQTSNLQTELWSTGSKETTKIKDSHVLPRSIQTQSIGRVLLNLYSKYCWRNYANLLHLRQNSIPYGLVHKCIESSLFWDGAIPILWSRLAWLASLDELKHGGKDSDPILKLFQRPLLQFDKWQRSNLPCQHDYSIREWYNAFWVS